jgi:hypothetical protein
VSATRTRRTRYWSKYPARRRAHWRVWRARKDGRLVPQPCWACGKPGPTEAHHPLGYEGDAALLVLWLCPSPCHLQAHGRKPRRVSSDA